MTDHIRESSVATDRRLVPSIEIGGAHVTAGLVDLDDPAGPVVHGARRAHLVATDSAELIVQRIVACAATVAAPPGAPWGAAVPGPFDYAAGVALFKDVGKFDQLYGLDLREQLSSALHFRPADIFFLNDAEAFLLGEWTAGAAREHDRAVGITLGTGIGSAFLADGRIVADGPLVPPEGSVHLLRVDGLPLEESVSTRAIMRRYLAAVPGADVTVQQVAERARAGEPAARTVFEQALRTLGVALSPWLARFDASLVVVGGSIARSWDLVASPLQAGIGVGFAGSTGLRVAPAHQPELAPLIGAAVEAAHAWAAGKASSRRYVLDDRRG